MAEPSTQYGGLAAHRWRSILERSHRPHHPVAETSDESTQLAPSNHAIPETRPHVGEERPLQTFADDQQYSDQRTLGSTPNYAALRSEEASDVS